MPDIQTFSQCFGLNKNQFELDFVDIPVNNGDVPLFIDPYAISKRGDYWSVDCHNAIVEFFQKSSEYGISDYPRRQIIVDTDKRLHYVIDQFPTNPPVNPKDN